MYKECDDYGNGYRVNYLNGIEDLINQRISECTAERNLFAKNIISGQDDYRNKYFDMLGWPLNCEASPIISITERTVFENDTYSVIRMQFELFKNYRFYGILFRHKSDSKLPLVVAQHGGCGTPEMCSSFFDSENYNNMSMRIFEKGVNVFAPQLDLWQTGRFGPDGKRDALDLKLKQLGGSIASLEIYSIMRCLDYFEQQCWCNNVFGMAGLSYGGFYTLYTAAADVRIKSALSCSHFNDRIKYGWASKNFKNAASTFLDAEVGALIYPRYLNIQVGDNDELFTAESAKNEYERLENYYSGLPENLDFNIFKGVHEFCPEDDSAINKMIAHLNL